MKLLLIAIFLLFATTTVVESFIISALIGFKIGYALASRNRGGHGGRSYGGRRNRWGRSIEDDIQIEQVMIKASLDDSDDCAKAFVCQLNAQPARTTPMELFVYEYFGSNVKSTIDGQALINVLNPTVQFDLAAHVGRLGGAQQCQQVYARCPMPYKDLLSVLESQLAGPQITQN